MDDILEMSIDDILLLVKKVIYNAVKSGEAKSGDYPSSMTIAKVSMGGIEIPMETSSTTIGGISYSVYKSKNQYIAGTHQVVVESSFGGGSGGAGININTSDDTMIFGDKQYKLIPVVEE